LLIQNQFYQAFRRTNFFMFYLRPVYENRLLRRWWTGGQPAPPPHSVKMSILLYLADSIKADNFIETGAYLGDTIRHMRVRFRCIKSIEIAEQFVRQLRQEFAGDQHIEIVHGDSGKELPRIVPLLNGPTLYWLDAHYSGGQTEGADHVPIFAEIRAISELARDDHIIAVDDMKDFNGTDGYPTELELKDFLEALGYRVKSFNNIMQAEKQSVEATQ
jgi:hypothetical protein